MAIPNYIIPINKGKKRKKLFFLYDSAINIHIISYLLTKKKKRKGRRRERKGIFFFFICMILLLIKDEALLTIGYTNFSHMTIVFIAKYLFTGSVKIFEQNSI